MATIFHVLAMSTDPANGGMEQSVLRISRHLATLDDSQVYLYVRASEAPPPAELCSGLIPVPLEPTRTFLLEPLSARHRLEERYRVDHLLFRNAVNERVQLHLGHSHVIVSFYISSAGFIAQHIASELGISHIASVRGTDFNRDFFSPYRLSAIEFVARNATCVVTTNRAQEMAFRNTFGLTSRVRTIYNALPGDIPPARWVARITPTVRIVADCGYSFGKGTHVLIAAVKRLVASHTPVQLWIVGDEDVETASYFSDLRRDVSSTWGDRFMFGKLVSRVETEEFLRRGDVYCSPSLGEGCSNTSLLALTMGMPIVATATGALPEIAASVSHVRLCIPGDSVQLTKELELMAQLMLAGGLEINHEQVERWRQQFSPAAERANWSDAVASSILKRGA